MRDAMWCAECQDSSHDYPDCPPTLWLDSQCLLSKWGFNDGNAPDVLLDWLDANGHDYPRNWRAALTELVRQHLLPVLDQQVEVEHIDGIHNPIRARTVDGTDVEDCWRDDQPAPTLTPGGVAVPLPRVLDAIRAAEEKP